MVNEDKVLTRQLMKKWFERAQIDYSDLFMNIYIAYNVWFRKVTGCNEDHEAIKRVTGRFVIWDDYLHGRTLLDLLPVVEEISTFTWRKPARPTVHAWDGIVKDSFDWKSLIYFWYQTRCDLFHGVTLPGQVTHDKQIQLAYESLNIFMTEIMRRMRYCFSNSDFRQLTEVRTLLASENGAAESLKVIEARLHQKFIHSPDLWNVDMERA
jgi:hypothetical protein